MPIEKSEFTKELIKILNKQYQNHHFDGYVQIFVDQALENSGFTLVPPDESKDEREQPHDTN